ncbi:MAG: hypothetical protein ABW194_07655, partial [Novosphingobium sp.]
PGLRVGGPDGPMAFAEVEVPAEILAKGPTGYRIKVVDYNATDKVSYKDLQDYDDGQGTLRDPFAIRPGETPRDHHERVVGDPNFHAQNVYAVAMRTLGYFERALGRRISWSFGGHQLHIAPHAFAQANAFYSEPDRTLMFGYFRNGKGEPVFTALSHDIVAHETTHALLDGLRTRYTEPSGPDQAAFHEGFADIVAVLSVFALEEVVAAAIGEDGTYANDDRRMALVASAKLTPDALRDSVLLGLGREFGMALDAGEQQALRRSVKLRPEDLDLASDDEHDRGELIVAIVLNTFVELWVRRIGELGTFDGKHNLAMVVEEGAKQARQLLTMCIRGIDYCPPTDMDFGQYLAAVLTADREVSPDDRRFGYRQALRRSAALYGVAPPQECDAEGCWPLFAPAVPLVYARSNFAAMTRDRDEVFRFVWENRDALGVSERAYTEVLSIDTAARAGPDGITITETICQYAQRADLFGAEVGAVLKSRRPEGLATKARLTAYGGGVLVLDQYGQVKYHIANPIEGGERQEKRLVLLAESGQLDSRGSRGRLRFGLCHLERMGA